MMMERFDCTDISALDATWPRQLVATDAPQGWTALVEQIAELEELLSELDGEEDRHAQLALTRVRQLLEARRRSLRAIDIG
jgi:hypothetical protein